MNEQVPSVAAPPQQPWYTGVTRYQWLVLAIASAGWVFDVFEGQLIVAVGNRHALPELLAGSGLEQYREIIFNVCLAAFLAGGAVGGVAFGMLADRWGRGRIMIVTILMYSLFTALTAFAQSWWHLAALRFLVGMGVGGEWAVAASVVAEVFPARARPAASGIFHGSSVLGTFLAAITGWLMVSAGGDEGWRYAFLLGLLPALLTLWVRAGMKEPESWQAARQQAGANENKQLGRITDLFAVPALRRHTLIGTALATIGLATFWGAHIRGKDLLVEAATYNHSPTSLRDVAAENNYDTLGMLLVTLGGGAGLLSFAPISQRLGRRQAFMLFFLNGFVFTVLLCLTPKPVVLMLLILPVFGFFTLGMHAGYAVYFPELFPTRLRGTGTGFCFNVARIIACPVLLGFGWLKDGPFGWDLRTRMLALGSLFLIGVWIAWLAPETRGQPLPE